MESFIFLFLLLILAAVALGVVVVIIAIVNPEKFKAILANLSADKATPATMPYRKRDWLLTKAERSFFGVLQQALTHTNGPAAPPLIMCKVRLADLLIIPRGTDKRQSWQNRINSKHIDFILVHPDTLQPLLAIELDDASHNRSDRRERDEFIDSALSTAELPLLRIPAQRSYNSQQLAEQIKTLLG